MFPLFFWMLWATRQKGANREPKGATMEQTRAKREPSGEPNGSQKKGAGRSQMEPTTTVILHNSFTIVIPYTCYPLQLLSFTIVILMIIIIMIMMLFYYDYYMIIMLFYPYYYDYYDYYVII